jgi:hypothetical protein
LRVLSVHVKEAFCEILRIHFTKVHSILFPLSDISIPAFRWKPGIRLNSEPCEPVIMNRYALIAPISQAIQPRRFWI